MSELEFTGERIVPLKTPYTAHIRHNMRYIFASKFVKNKVVLEIGLGAGDGSFYLLNKGAKKIIAIDVAEESVRYAKEKYSVENLDFMCMDGTDLDFPDNFFDIVVTFEVIEHIKDYKKFLYEIKRVLKPQGMLIISTPSKEIASPFSSKPLNPYHIKEFSRREFYSLLGNFFINIKQYGQRPYSFYSKVKHQLLNLSIRYGSPMLSSIPLVGTKTKDFFRYTIFEKKDNIDIPKLGLNISEEVLDKTYDVILWRGRKSMEVMVAIVQK